ncbi:homoserine O-acetyltransferase [Kribbella orskensis]|uniref:Homoserine O-acetyltransferase n=1 Tax=Kribbella orskensis TaxID=2512216 RepID=A0ABY2BNV5_9ACTN|nr:MULTISPECIES: alpha/beta fold hydrolase [Kribbella]TCN42065.1 homoserine O-acetyltransferase [Kribbella sp. VKM Ac-2500]TCO25943.1 homoserine O-acetyltransferase [Kribbella orskensis]
MTSWPVETGVFELGDLPVERGGVIRGAELAWQTHGTLSPAKDNVIVYPCSYGATHETQDWLIGPDGVLDPERWFIVMPDLFSNGLSSSASSDPEFPSLVTMADNVHVQYRLLSEYFGITRLAAAYGFSMGAGQAYHWASLYPDVVERAIVVCGSARTSLHNRVFLTGLLSILEAAPEHLGNGRFSAEPVAAKRAFAHVYAGWGLSQDFYRERLFESLGAPDLDTFLQTDWVDRFAESSSADQYAQALTWLEADISTPYAGDLDAALGAIVARVLLLPSATDLYFRTADNELELASLRKAELVEIPSLWGHRAGSPRDIPADLAFLREHVRDWLAS